MISYSRLRWQCRRGRLENDLLLERYLARIEAQQVVLSEAQQGALHQLLALADDDLYEVLSGQARAPDAACEALAHAIRAADA